jgi:hypothetical protein
MAKETPHLRLRLEATLLARLEKAAEKNGRTLTGEISRRLTDSFKGDDFEAALDKLAERATVRVGNMIRSNSNSTPDAIPPPASGISSTPASGGPSARRRSNWPN